ncbi:MAG: 30S ribosomal protein S17 [Alphaproteobacteria bacterium]
MPRRVLQGVVVSDKGDKTIVVRVERRFRHPLYKKYIRSTKKYHAHDADNACKVGETVRIVESRPHSKTKRWELLSRERAAAEVEL